MSQRSWVSSIRWKPAHNREPYDRIQIVKVGTYLDSLILQSDEKTLNTSKPIDPDSFYAKSLVVPEDYPLSFHAISNLTDVLVKNGSSDLIVSFVIFIFGFPLMLIHLCIGLVRCLWTMGRKTICYQFCSPQCYFFRPTVINTPLLQFQASEVHFWVTVPVNLGESLLKLVEGGLFRVGLEIRREDEGLLDW